jgi:Ca2+-transporting ATPase
MKVDELTGLTAAEAARRLETDGPNELPTQKRSSALEILAGVLREPMFLLLLACGALYLLSGEVREAVLLLGFVFVVIGITFYQERKTERALEALRDLSSPRALVIRGGEKLRIPGRDVVVGDVVLLAEGDRVPADAVLVHALNFSTDESLLTGESVPVRKRACDAKTQAMGKPGGDDLPFVFSGTLVVSGQAIGLVRATGVRTELGKIGKALQGLETERTPLQVQTGRIVRTFAISGAALCAIVVLVYWLTRGALLKGFLAGLSLAMAMLPEEFPVVLTVFLALGAWRISKNGVLTRRVPAVETLGSASVLCVDKTGTLTQNRMTVTDLVVGDEWFKIDAGRESLPETFHECVEYSILASPADPFDPMEKAMKELGVRTLRNTQHLHSSWILQREYPLSRELMAVSRVWAATEGGGMVIAAKGAPEAIADLCHFNAEQTAWLQRWIDTLSQDGKRVIGVARAVFAKPELPSVQHDFPFEFVGLLGLEDPVRPGVREAIAECYTAGIRTIMITGDYPGTAMSIARQIGLRDPGEYMTGVQLEAADEATLAERIRKVNVFARMVPEQKLRIVQALKANGEVVAMTGDGVNDAPALKAAHIGVAMGARGTDVARESAGLVLLNDDFNSIVAAVRMGRRIYENLKKAMMYIFSVHIPIAGLSLIPVLFNWPLILFPVHIVFLELIIDPACTLVFEADNAEKDVMRQPPRRIDANVFDGRTIARCLLQGGVALIVTLLVYNLVRHDHPVEAARALSFLTLVVCNLGMILSNRSLSRSILSNIMDPNKALWWVFFGTIVALTLVISVPFLQSMFQFGLVSSDDLMLSLAGGVVAVGIMEASKLLTRIRGDKAVV